MGKPSTSTAKCLCGAVTLQTAYMAETFSACHCGMCRRWGGGPFLAVDCGSDVKIDGAEHVTVYDSSPWAERGFCKACGSHLFYRLKGSREHQVPLGLLGDPDDRNFGLQVFIDCKPQKYSFAEETTVLTEAQVIEIYASKE